MRTPGWLLGLGLALTCSCAGSEDSVVRSDTGSRSARPAERAVEPTDRAVEPTDPFEVPRLERGEDRDDPILCEADLGACEVPVFPPDVVADPGESPEDALERATDPHGHSPTARLTAPDRDATAPDRGAIGKGRTLEARR